MIKELMSQNDIKPGFGKSVSEVLKCKVLILRVSKAYRGAE